MVEKELFKHAQSLGNFKEEEIAIEVNHITKNYGKSRGLFDVSFVVPKGKTFGYCGTNGAGKTTTLRHIMCFLKPDSGYVKVYGMDAWKEAEEIKKYIGYLPGEIAFPPLESGTDFLKSQAEMLGVNDMSKAERIVNALQLDPTANLKRMSKGMKQKTAIVSALMLQAPIVILDEPTTGLDPLMRDEFLNIVDEQREKGTTIIMSSNTIEELERVCTKICFLSKGKVIDYSSKKDIESIQLKDYVVVFENEDDYNSAKKITEFSIRSQSDEKKSITFRVDIAKTKEFFGILKKYHIKFLNINEYNLATYFEDKRKELLGGK